jgi:hypothetical protein
MLILLLIIRKRRKKKKKKKIELQTKRENKKITRLFRGLNKSEKVKVKVKVKHPITGLDRP